LSTSECIVFEDILFCIGCMFGKYCLIMLVPMKQNSVSYRSWTRKCYGNLNNISYKNHNKCHDCIICGFPKKWEFYHYL